jgi:hypothetical protein
MRKLGIKSVIKKKFRPHASKQKIEERETF